MSLLNNNLEHVSTYGHLLLQWFSSAFRNPAFQRTRDSYLLQQLCDSLISSLQHKKNRNDRNAEPVKQRTRKNEREHK